MLRRPGELGRAIECNPGCRLQIEELTCDLEDCIQWPRLRGQEEGKAAPAEGLA